MRAVWDLFNADPLSQHIFTIPCDSHGLQLLITDIVETEPYEEVLKGCQTIVGAFKQSKLQFNLLRKHQQAINGKTSSFCLSVISR